jgi:hypothetical protein
MNMDFIPVWALFAATMIGVVTAIEAGYRLGRAVHRRAEDEKESPVSAISASILGLLAFMLAFTFGIVTERFDARKALVREETNAIGTTYLRTDFLPELDRGEAKRLIREYVNHRVAAVQKHDYSEVNKLLSEPVRIQRKLWDMAVANARKDMNSDVAALYIESLNEVIDLHAMRVAIGLQARIPIGIWLVLYILVFFGMISVGYQTAIAGSRRSWATLILAVSFAMVLALIILLDRPHGGFITVSQQPLVDLRASMDAGFEEEP